jgi:hypothetical protein
MDCTVHIAWEVTAGGKSYTLPAGYPVSVRDSRPWHETVILEFLWPPGTDFDDTILAPVLATDVDRYTDVIMTPMDPTKRIVRFALAPKTWLCTLIPSLGMWNLEWGMRNEFI